jgi:hypothetical protein
MTTTRVDRKYVVSEAVLEELLSATRECWSADTTAGLDVQHYETEYFDTADLHLFHAARGRRPLRNKVRVRHYLDTATRFLEVKSRNVRGETVKVRETWSGALDDARPLLDASLGREAALIDSLVPTARTAYERTALVVDDGSRVTIDRHLNVGPSGRITHQLFDEGSELVIVETKAPDRSPTAIDHWLWDRHIRPASLSKYALAVASFRPDLPLNRWTREARRLHPIR